MPTKLNTKVDNCELKLLTRAQKMQSTECRELKSTIMKLTGMVMDLNDKMDILTKKVDQIENHIFKTRPKMQIASKNFNKLTKYTRGTGMFKSQQIHQKSRRELSKAKPAKKRQDSMRKSSSIIEISQADLPIPIKTIKISDESNLSANVLYKSDEKCINDIRENLGNPMVQIKKLKHNEDIIFSMLTNCKAKIQKAKKTGHLRNPTTSKASNASDFMDESGSNDSGSYESYNINNLNPDDESDKENLPRKRIPLWAQEPNLSMTVEEQASKQIPYKELFRASANTEIKLKMSDKHKRVHSET